MALLWKLISEEYASLTPTAEAQYSQMSISMFTDPDKPHNFYPKLKGQAQEIKGFVRPIANVWAKYKRAGDRIHNTIAELLGHQLDIQTVLHTYSDRAFLPEPAGRDFRLSIKLFLKKYSIVSQWAIDQKLLVFNCPIKFHWLYHLMLRSAFLNPRRGCCAVDEDYVGKCKTVVASAVHGTKPHNVPQAVGDKMTWLQALISEYGV